MIHHNSPLYLQIKKYLEKEIDTGIYKTHDQLPSEIELAKKFNVSRITSKNAILQLVEDGKVYRIPGKGTFVGKPNAKQSSSQQNKRPFIGFIMPEVADRYCSQILSSIESAVSNSGYGLMIQQSHHYIDVEKQAIQALLNDGADGLIIFPVDDEVYNEKILRLTLDHFPIVLIDRYLSGIETPAVYSDNIQGAYELTKILLEKKHLKIGLFSAPNFETATVKDRIKGYEKALDETGIPIDRSIWFTELLHENPLERAISFLQANPDITGIFAMNAFAGEIAYKAAKRLGKQIPEEFLIASFDQEHELDIYPIYTAKQDSVQIGEKSVELLQTLLQPKTKQTVEQIVLPVNICFNSKWEN